MAENFSEGKNPRKLFSLQMQNRFYAQTNNFRKKNEIFIGTIVFGQLILTNASKITKIKLLNFMFLYGKTNCNISIKWYLVMNSSEISCIKSLGDCSNTHELCGCYHSTYVFLVFFCKKLKPIFVVFSKKHKHFTIWEMQIKKFQTFFCTYLIV